MTMIFLLEPFWDYLVYNSTLHFTHLIENRKRKHSYDYAFLRIKKFIFGVALAYG